jgi:hypothetical protein
MRRGFFGLILVALLCGTPVINIALLWLVGTNEVVYNPGRPDSYSAISGPSAPRPVWLPRLPKAVVATAHQVTSGRQDGFGTLDLVTTLSLGEIKDFYQRTLSELGFSVHDDGIGTLTPAAADFLGIGGTLLAERPHDSREEYKWVSVQISAEEGWFLSTRYVSLQWRRMTPDMLAQFKPARP